jgi:hypothetical protein
MPPSPARFDRVGHRRSHFLYGLKASEGPNVVYPLVSLRIASICPEGFLSIGRSRARTVRRKEGFQEVGLKCRLTNIKSRGGQPGYEAHGPAGAGRRRTRQRSGRSPRGDEHAPGVGCSVMNDIVVRRPSPLAVCGSAKGARGPDNRPGLPPLQRGKRSRRPRRGTDANGVNGGASLPPPSQRR